MRDGDLEAIERAIHVLLITACDLRCAGEARPSEGVTRITVGSAGQPVIAEVVILPSGDICIQHADEGELLSPDQETRLSDRQIIARLEGRPKGLPPRTCPRCGGKGKI